MRKQETKLVFHSPLGQLMIQFVHEKQACGYRYDIGIQALRRLDRFLCESGLQSVESPREIVDRWTAKRSHERAGTQKLRIAIVRQFTLFVCRQGFNAHVPEPRQTAVVNLDFVPYVFRHEEVNNILEAADRLPPDKRTPLRHLIVPKLFRLLYCCGMRVGEVLRLRVADVDLDAGILTVRNAKFDKDRLLPLPNSLTERLRHCATALGEPGPEAIFFPAPDGGPYRPVTVYGLFRRFLLRLPEDIREQLFSKLENRRQTYAEIASDITSQGYKVSTSAVHRLGKRIENERRAVGETIRDLAKVIRRDPQLREKVLDYGFTCLAQDLLRDQIVEAIEQGGLTEEDCAKEGTP